MVQMVAFLGERLSQSEYSSMLPSLQELLETYKLRPAVAFALARPLMSGASSSSAWNPTAPDLLAVVRKYIRPQPNWSAASPEMFSRFWSLKLADLYFPEEQYALEQTRITRQRAELDTDITMAVRLRGRRGGGGWQCLRVYADCAVVIVAACCSCTSERKHARSCPTLLLRCAESEMCRRSTCDRYLLLC